MTAKQAQPKNLADEMAWQFKKNGPMSAAEMTGALRESDNLPPYWSVIDVADYMREWFS